jgi:hypothetical protein
MPNFIEIGPVVLISIADTHGTHIDFYILDYAKCRYAECHGAKGAPTFSSDIRAILSQRFCLFQIHKNSFFLHSLSFKDSYFSCLCMQSCISSLKRTSLLA